MRWVAGVAAMVAVLAGALVLRHLVVPGPTTSPQLGPFAGYVWRGGVISVAAAWSVPRIAAGSRPGRAATWVAAQGAGDHGPFIQVGIDEQRGTDARSGAPRDVYAAFWSDTARGFHEQLLFVVRPSDEVSVSLRHIRRRWLVAIADATSGARARFSTGQEARASFQQAEWIQEDVTDAATGRPFAYPTLSTLRMRALRVNGRPPSGAGLVAVSLTLGDRVLSPGPLQSDSFTLRSAAPRHRA